MTGTSKLLRIPAKVRTLAELCGVISQCDGLEHIVVLIEDGDGTWAMTLDGATAERMNWMLDRGKLLVHRAD